MANFSVRRVGKLLHGHFSFLCSYYYLFTSLNPSLDSTLREFYHLKSGQKRSMCLLKILTTTGPHSTRRTGTGPWKRKLTRDSCLAVSAFWLTGNLRGWRACLQPKVRLSKVFTPTTSSQTHCTLMTSSIFHVRRRTATISLLTMTTMKAMILLKVTWSELLSILLFWQKQTQRPCFWTKKASTRDRHYLWKLPKTNRDSSFYLRSKLCIKDTYVYLKL